MSETSKSRNPHHVPASMWLTYHQLCGLLDGYAETHLNEEYAALARRMAAALARKRPSPLRSGYLETWACSIFYALGKINFLFDRAQNPHVRADDLCAAFGVAASTGSAKAKAVLDQLRIRGHDSNWTLPSRLMDHPFLWLVSVNGFVTDIRTMPRDIQEAALRKGIIPFIPEKPPNE